MAAKNVPLLIEQGASFSMRLWLSSTTLDFTGATGRGQIRKKYSDADAYATFTVTPGTDVHPDTGLDTFFLDITLDEPTTKAFVVDKATDYNKKLTKTSYDVELVMADLTVHRLIEGVADISPEDTKNE